MPKIDEQLNNPGTLHQKLGRLINSTISLPHFAEAIFDLIFTDISFSSTALVFHDVKKGIISFPYLKGLSENARTRTLEGVNSPLKAVINQKQPLLVKAPEYLGYCKDKSAVESIPVLWIGLPIFKDNNIFAVLLIIENNGTRADKIEELKESNGSILF